MEKSKIDIRFGLLILFVLLAAFSRLIPHPPNFAPLGAIALFGAAYFKQKHTALLILVLSLWLSDFVINNVSHAQYFEAFVFFFQGFHRTYLAFAFIGGLGFLLLKKTKPKKILLASLSASALFSVVSNFVIVYSRTVQTQCISI